VTDVDGENLAAYEFHEKLGEGGMGAVYRAADRRIGRTVAIKMIRADRLASDPARQRFTREARSIGGLNHPNIATLYDVALTGDEPYIVMEYLPGGSLEQRISRGPMMVGKILRYAMSIASGLDHAHGHGVVHRDLKPANILFSADDVPKIIDFGLARMTESSELTAPGVVMGTAEYLSPEQARGGPPDPRSDIFSFGVILYYMASGRHPFRIDSIPATLHRIVYQDVPALEVVRPDLPVSFARLIGAMLDKRPKNRPTLRDVIENLRSLEISEGGDTQTMVVPATRPSRRVYPWMAAALVALALIASLGWWARGRWLSGKLPESRQLAVLPFENLSHDPLEQAFCDGLVELLTSSLTQLERFHSTLWVIPSADVRRQQLRSVRDARKAFPVNLAITGSLQSDEDQVLVIVNLSDATTTRQIGSRMIPVRRADRGQLATRLTSAVIDLLDLGSSAADEVHDTPPKVLSAYDSYVQAKGFVQHADVPGNVDRAIALLEQSVQQDPNSALSQSALGDAYLRRYTATKEKVWLAKADQMLQRSLELDPSQGQVHLNVGRMFRATGQIDKAIEEMRRAVALDPLNVSALTNLASAYAEARRPGDAEDAYLQAVRIRPSYYSAYSNLGNFYVFRGEYAKALEPLSVAVKLAPDYAQGHANLATLFYYTERWDEALAEYGRSLAVSPTANAYSNRGAIYHFRGDYEHAREEYKHALELDGKDPVTWGNLGDAETRIPGAAADAKESYQRAIRLSREQLAVKPNNADVLGRMAFYLARTSNCAEARTRMRESLRLAPDRVPLIFKSAKVAETCNDRQSALTYLETAIQKGYPLREIENDPDLETLRKSPAYAAIRPKTATEKK
jgi:tetratricopeptide (TPR) repeat protein/tRNA A-37 threonylcarbamoyl transferase component Bud32/TolB-like protein